MHYDDTDQQVFRLAFGLGLALQQVVLRFSFLDHFRRSRPESLPRRFGEAPLGVLPQA